MVRRRRLRELGLWACGIALVSVIAGGLLARAQIPSETNTITWYYPLWRAAELLQSRYARVVTYEGPTTWLWRETLDLLGHMKDGREIFRAKEHALVLPEELTGELTSKPAPVLNLELVSKVVAAYNRQNPGFPRYGVLESKLGFHIVPVEVPDETGRYVPATNLLDTRVSVPVAQRTASEHLKAICDAVSVSTGRPLVINGPSSFDGYFGANGYQLPKARTGRERPYILFEWGIQDVKARDALINLLEGSCTTMRWLFVCELTPPLDKTRCHITMNPLTVAGRNQAFDRCANFRFIPAQ